jgi:uncharacterized protein (DUF885 family)
MTTVFELCDEYVIRHAALDPVNAGMRGITGEFGAATDYGPDGDQARAELIVSTLAALGSAPVASDADRLAAGFLRERLEAQLAWHRAGEPLRLLRAPFGLVSMVKDSVDLLPRASQDDWRNVVARLAAIPRMFATWRTSLEAGLAAGLPAARRQALESAVQADRLAGAHDDLVASYGDGPLAGELAAAAAQAQQGYDEIARYLREQYAPRARETDGVGAERYAVASRLTLGADIDPVEAYEWGWAELGRIQAELAAEADKISPGASVAEAAVLLNQSEYVTGADAYLAWLQDRHDQAIEQLDGVHFDIAPPLRRIEVVLDRSSTSGAAGYTPPTEDLSRPGRTWWPLGGRDPGGRFATWGALSTVFHEGVPGHHLQAGAAKTAGDKLSRFAKASSVSGHSEGWALYAERLADELGWFVEPGTRLGMLGGSAVRAARVVIDIGVHLDLPLPDGSRWTFEKACEVLQEQGRAEPYRVHAEVVRYFGWPGQAISYKLGERAWLAAREEARRRPGFDLKRWHTAALSIGPIGLAGLADALAGIAAGPGGVLSRPVVDDAAHLAHGSLDRIRFHDAGGHGDTDAVLDQGAELGARLLRVGPRHPGAALDVDRKLVHPADPAQVQLEVRRQGRDPHDEFLDLGREQVDPAQDDHVVGAAGDLLHAAHGARGPRQQPGQVPGPVPDDRHGLLGQ